MEFGNDQNGLGKHSFSTLSTAWSIPVFHIRKCYENVMIFGCDTIQLRIHISQTHHCPKTKIGTQGEKALSNAQKKFEKISNIILVIGGQKLILITFDLQIN